MGRRGAKGAGGRPKVLPPREAQQHAHLHQDSRRAAQEECERRGAPFTADAGEREKHNSQHHPCMDIAVVCNGEARGTGGGDTQ